MSFKYIITELKNNVAIAQLSRGKANPINTELLKELHTFYDSVLEDDTVQGIILTGKEPFFSVGVDLIEVIEYDQKSAGQFWTLLIDLMIKMTRFPKPHIAAVSGYAPAGGCVLAIPADYRVMNKGKYTIGLNEAPLGLIVPEIFFNLYSFWLGNAKGYQYLIEGRLLTPTEALKAGLVDELAERGKLINAALKKMSLYLSIIPDVFKQNKLNFRRELIKSMDINTQATVESFLHQWFSENTRKRLESIVNNLKK